MKYDFSKNGLMYLDIICQDPRLTVWHMSLITAILRLANHQNERNPIHVSRSKLMKMSCIKTAPTYHKYFKELQIYGYIKYTPSYHPRYKSTVEIIPFINGRPGHLFNR
jgi:hypothetical protein